MVEQNAKVELFGEPTNSSINSFYDFELSLARSSYQVDFPNHKKLLNSLTNKKFAGRQQQIVALDPQAGWIGHVVARVSPTLRDLNGKPLGMIGFFSAKNYPQAIEALLASAIEWLNNKGCQSIVGPINGDTWGPYRFNCGPLDEPYFLSEPNNPQFYPNLWRNAGFEVAAGYHSKIVDDISVILSTVQQSYEAATSQGYQFRPINVERFHSELETLYKLSIASFNNNFLYDEISLEGFRSLYADAKSLIDPRLVWIASDNKGTDVGFLFCIVNYAVAVRAMGGKSNIWSKLKFLLARGQADAVNFKSICVLPSHRRSNVAAALMYLGYKESLSKGFKRANLCLIKDGNPSTRLDGGKSRMMRKYEIYMTPGSKLA